MARMQFDGEHLAIGFPKNLVSPEREHMWHLNNMVEVGGLSIMTVVQAKHLSCHRVKTENNFKMCTFKPTSGIPGELPSYPNLGWFTYYISHLLSSVFFTGSHNKIPLTSVSMIDVTENVLVTFFRCTFITTMHTQNITCDVPLSL